MHSQRDMPFPPRVVKMSTIWYFINFIATDPPIDALCVETWFLSILSLYRLSRFSSLYEYEDWLEHLLTDRLPFSILSNVPPRLQGRLFRGA